MEFKGTFIIRDALILAFSLVIISACKQADVPYDNRIWYAQPASEWNDALPVGNGRLGAMVFGGIKRERIQLNEDSMWPGGPDWGNSKGTLEYLKYICSLLDWDKPYPEAEEGHRHMSHLYALHPGNVITSKNSELFEAARKSLQYRLDHGGAGTGWSRAWLINFSARLLDPEAVSENIELFLQKSTADNLFDMHPPFQIDGNFGFTAGIAEALLQSQNDVIHILPALPKEWENGHIKGLLARGGYEVDISWENNKLKKLTLRSINGRPGIIRYEAKEVSFEMKAEETIRFGPELNQVR